MPRLQFYKVRQIFYKLTHPRAAIERPGYYRVDVTGERTSFITRRAGQATVTPASGQAVAIAPSEEVVIEGTANPQVTSYVAPQLDDWDKWNYARTDALLDAVSARYVAPGTYGVDDLDRYGTWRVVPTYGPVWVPTAVPAGWVPYSTGAWMLDPFYGWTWVDTAPWGWAPYHHGRWVSVGGFWAWAPGPVLVRPVYAPALVAFLGGPGARVSVGGPIVGWVALGWGEPLVPWWGRAGFIHVPWWGGWGGPHVVNNVVINTTTVVKVENITVYRNSSVQNAVVAVNENRFGHGPIRPARLSNVEVREFHPIHTAPQVAATPASFVPTAKRGIRPSEEILRRPVVATRPPRLESPAFTGERKVGPTTVPTPAPRIVSVPQQRETAPVLPRPPFGQSTVERPRPDRSQVPKPPGREATRREAQGVGPSPVAPPPSARRAEAPGRPLPGEPANWLSPNRAENRPPQQGSRPAAPDSGHPAGGSEKGGREHQGG